MSALVGIAFITYRMSLGRKIHPPAILTRDVYEFASHIQKRHCSCMCVHNVDNQEVHSPDLPFKVLAKPCKRERKLLQTSPEKTESCALDCTLSPDTLVKAFVQMIANTQFTETEKQVRQTS